MSDVCRREVLGATLVYTAGGRMGVDRPNVLMIAVDDLRPELGCQGRTHVHSPNMDCLRHMGLLRRLGYGQRALGRTENGVTVARFWPGPVGLECLPCVRRIPVGWPLRRSGEPEP
ncbi:MAG: hypothetical protein FJX72_02560 [Armatimonadetes bacterium]|nr:hypothetical protein [Armatimonadota bacterium]